jgi:virginiamycin B lyase
MMITGDLVYRRWVAVALGCLAFVQAPAFSQSLGGKVTSAAEPVMEGVIVSARKAGSPIMVSVVTDAQGRYRFPDGRLEAGSYTLSIRAAGYDLEGPSKINVASGSPTEANLTLKPAGDLAAQLSNAEWMLSAPGTDRQKADVNATCTPCHSLQRIVLSRHNAEDMAKVLQRMSAHATNASPRHPYYLQTAAAIMQRPPTKEQIALAEYLSSINLGSGERKYPLKTLPRPKGKATQVIYTTYHLARDDAAPHDTELDREGNIWYMDFQSPFIGKVERKTGKVTEYPIPLQKPLEQGWAAGGLQLALDKDGLVYASTMSQAQIARFDPRSGKMEVWPTPRWKNDDSRITMVDPAFSHVDGKVWANESGGPERTIAYQVDLKTNTWTRVPQPEGGPSISAYDIIADSRNNLYGIRYQSDVIWHVDAKTLKTTYYQTAPKGGGRRGHVDSRDRLWFGAYLGNTLTMFDPVAAKFTEWKIPTPFTNPYDAMFDDRLYAWTGGMSTDMVQRVNTQTNEIVEYLLPHSTNIRHVNVEKGGKLSGLWVPDQHDGRIVYIEPLSP